MVWLPLIAAGTQLCCQAGPGVHVHLPCHLHPGAAAPSWTAHISRLHLCGSQQARHSRSSPYVSQQRCQHQRLQSGWHQPCGYQRTACSPSGQDHSPPVGARIPSLEGLLRLLAVPQLSLDRQPAKCPHSHSTACLAAGQIPAFLHLQLDRHGSSWAGHPVHHSFQAATATPLAAASHPSLPGHHEPAPLPQQQHQRPSKWSAHSVAALGTAPHCQSWRSAPAHGSPPSWRCGTGAG